MSTPTTSLANGAFTFDKLQLGGDQLPVDASFFDELDDLDDVLWCTTDVPPPLGADGWEAAPRWMLATLSDTQPAAAPPSPTVSLHLYHCLDATHHGFPCSDCAPPPSEGEEGDYELLFEGSGYKGQKQLRAQLCRTKEWNSGEARAELAAVCDARSKAPGADEGVTKSHATLALALRCKRSAGLTKGQMLCMARAWGYASYLWVRHGRASRKRAAEAASVTAASPVESAAVTPRSIRARLHAGGYAWGASVDGCEDLGAAVTPSAVHAEVSAQLLPLARTAGAHMSGVAAKEAVQTAGCYFGEDEVEAIRSARDTFAAAATAWEAAALAPPPDGSTDAPWRALLGTDTDAEMALRGLAATLRQAAHANCGVRYFAKPAGLDADRAQLQDAIAESCVMFDPRSADAQARLPATIAPRADQLETVPPEQVGACTIWMYEMYAGIVALVELCVRLEALLCDAKLAKDWAAFAAADAAARQVAAIGCAEARDGFGKRLAWMGEQLRAAAGGPPRRRRPLFSFPPAAATTLPAPPQSREHAV